MNYEKTYIGMIDSLSSINASVLIHREEERNIIRQNNLSQSVYYNLSVPKTFLEFDGDKIAFYHWKDFSDIVGAYKEPNIAMDGASCLVVGEERSSIKFRLSNPTTIKGTFDETNLPESDYKISLPKELLAKIRKFCALVNAEQIHLRTKGDSLTLHAYSVDSENVWDDTLEGGEKIKRDLNVHFPIDIFDSAPLGDYDLGVSQDGLLTLTYLDDVIGLRLFATASEGNS